MKKDTRARLLTVLVIFSEHLPRFMSVSKGIQILHVGGLLNGYCSSIESLEGNVTRLVGGLVNVCRRNTLSELY